MNLTRYFTQASNWSPRRLAEENWSRWRHNSCLGDVSVTDGLFRHKHHKWQNEESIGITIFVIDSMYLALHYIRDVCYTHFTGNPIPDSKVHGANMGPTWVLSAPGGPHVGPMNLAVRLLYECEIWSWVLHLLLPCCMQYPAMLDCVILRLAYIDFWHLSASDTCY